MGKGMEEFERDEKFLWKIITLFASKRNWDKMDHEGQQRLLRDLREILREFKNG